MFNFFIIIELYMNSILVFIIAMTIMFCSICYLHRQKPEIISSSYYPDILKLTTYKKTFINDIAQYSKARKWINQNIWENAQNYDNIIYDETFLNIDLEKPRWLGFVLRLNKILVSDNIYMVPNTTKSLLNIPEPINLVVTCIEPNYYLKIPGKSSTSPQYRAFIPILVAEKESEPRPTLIKEWSETNFKIGDILSWDKKIEKDPDDISIDKTTGIGISGTSYNLDDIEKNNDLIIFDKNLDYQVWNKTKKNSYVLIIDIAK